MVALFWPGVSASFLAVGSFLLPPPVIQKTWPIPLFTNLLLPLVVVAAVGIYARLVLFHGSEKDNS
jgi:hypothetical protein